MPPFRMVRPRRAWTPPKPKPPVYRGPKLLPGPPRGKRGRAATAAAAPSFNPLTAITWEAVFFAYPDSFLAPPAVQPVCRFYAGGLIDSHFFTANAAVERKPG